jgi:hypothetical protein
MMARQNEFTQFRQNLIDPNTWHGCRGILSNMLTIPWVRTWWIGFDKATFTPEFIAVVEAILAEDHSFDYHRYLDTIRATAHG